MNSRMMMKIKLLLAVFAMSLGDGSPGSGF